ncbi:MAG: hypothetical protein ONB46_08205 [candidate division KSB1 bacterium]|nr:hypothetical protein [candidate division KSB1 bacterium]MDZ7365747.1 hypothetical protein [candidate division KSB1 bacterium]MDZ7403773.1 hypothetical protein [candidate division KSB1 bacterium]
MPTPKPYPEQEASPANQPDKIAEAVSPYITRSETERATLHRKPRLRYIAGLPASDEVWRFAQENALVPHVETAVRLARETFKEIREIKLTYSPDPEIPHWETIALDIYVSGTIDELLETDAKYRRAFTTTIPDAKQFNICTLLHVVDK